MMSIMRANGLLLALLSLLACGGDDDGGESGDPGDPVSLSEADETCGRFSDHADTCGWGGNINGTDWNCGEAAIVWRADVFRAVATCAIDLACDGDGRSCLEQGAGFDPLPIHDQYAATCDTKSGECELTPDSDASTLLLACSATFMAAYATPMMDAILACFDEPCAAVVPCLDDTL